MNESKSTEKWQGFLPKNSAATIKEELDLTISIRHINRIIAGESTDKYNVLDTAIEMAKVEKRKRNKRLKAMQRLVKN